MVEKASLAIVIDPFPKNYTERIRSIKLWAIINFISLLYLHTELKSSFDDEQQLPRKFKKDDTENNHGMISHLSISAMPVQNSSFGDA